MTLFSSQTPSKYLLLGVSLLIPIFLWRRRSLRTRKIAPTDEHVLVLGASGGVGRALAIEYSRRGAHVCIVARRKDALAETMKQCELAPGRQKTIAVATDVCNPEDMIALRERLISDWGRLDTLAVIAGVSSVKPLLNTAGVEWERGQPIDDASLQGVQDSVQVARAAIQGNFIGPYTAAITFIPLLSRTSLSPSILLLSSAAAVIPAPTRSLYCASKSASLLLYQSLAAEHRDINITAVLPGTIEGDFRKSAVDSTTTQGADPNKHGLRRETVAARCIRAIDRMERTVFMGETYRLAQMLYYWLSPQLIEILARRKYNFK